MSQISTEPQERSAMSPTHSPVFTEEEKAEFGILSENEINQFAIEYYDEKAKTLRAAINTNETSYVGYLDANCACSYCVYDGGYWHGQSVTCSDYSDSSAEVP